MDLPFDTITDRDWQTASPDGSVRLAMVGLGWWTREQAIPAVVRSSFCETTVLASGTAAKAQTATELADSIDHGLTYDAFHDGTAADAYDAVYIGTPNARHLPFVETAARLGKDVLCEKPMEATVPRAREIVRLADEAGIEVMVAYRMQTEPLVRRARELVDAGRIGDPVQVQATMSQRLLQLIPDRNQWRLDPELSGGATVMDLGVYPINTTRFVLGADPIAVLGQVVSEHEAFEAVGDEHAAFTLVFPGGVYAGCTASQNAHQSSLLRITGTEGEITLDPAFFSREDRGFSVSVGAERIDIDGEQVDQMTEEFDYFGYHLLTDTAVGPDPAHGLVDMEVMEAVYESATTGERVEILEN